MKKVFLICLALILSGCYGTTQYGSYGYGVNVSGAYYPNGYYSPYYTNRYYNPYPAYRYNGWSNPGYWNGQGYRHQGGWNNWGGQGYCHGGGWGHHH